MKEYNKVTPKPVVPDRKEDILEEPTKKRRVLDYEAVPHKKKFFERVSSNLFGDHGITGYLTSEIVIPAIKNIVVDSVTSGINMAIYGETKGRSKAGAPTRGGYTNYAKAYDRISGRATPQRNEKVRASNRVDEYVIRDRAEAVEVMETMLEVAAVYGTVSVADYYDLIGIDTTYTDNSYGWTEDDVRHFTIRPITGGYIINLPKPVALT